MDFGHGGAPRPTWGGDVDDGYMRGAARPPSIDFRAVAAGVPKDQGGGILNPGPSPGDATTEMFGVPRGELFLGPQDSHITAPSYAPIVHGLFVKDIGVTNIDNERFYEKGTLAAILKIPEDAVTKKSETQRLRRSLNKRWQDQIQPTTAILGPVNNSVLVDGYECTGLYPLSEGTIFPPKQMTEHAAITIHDHAEVVTANPRWVKTVLFGRIINDEDLRRALEATELYHPDNTEHVGMMGSVLWVVPIVAPTDDATGHKVHMVPVVNPDEHDRLFLAAASRSQPGPPGLVAAVAGIYHIGAIKQTYTWEDDNWDVTFSHRLP